MLRSINTSGICISWQLSSTSKKIMWRLSFWVKFKWKIQLTVSRPSYKTKPTWSKSCKTMEEYALITKIMDYKLFCHAHNLTWEVVICLLHIMATYSSPHQSIQPTGGMLSIVIHYQKDLLSCWCLCHVHFQHSLRKPFTETSRMDWVSRKPPS